MTEEIRKIISDYQSEGDYEKALSLLLNLPLEDDSDKTILEQCKKEFTSSCTTSIADAVKAKDKNKAERILSSYIKLMGEDANSELFRTLVDSIQSNQAPVTNPAKESRYQNFIKEYFSNSSPSEDFFKSKLLWFYYAGLFLIICIFGFIADNSGHDNTQAFCASNICLALALAFPVIKSNNNKFRIIALCLLAVSIIAVLTNWGGEIPRKTDPRTLTWLFTIPLIVVYNALLPKVSREFRIASSFLLFTILNPSFWGLTFMGGIDSYLPANYDVLHSSTNYNIILHCFKPWAIKFIVIGSLISLTIYFCSICGWENVKSKIINNRKKILIGLAAVMGLVIISIGVTELKKSHDQKIEREQAQIKARQDSIQAVEDARIAAIEKARQDSIAAVRRQEQARRDSIDYAEHLGFVNKYANIGLIITQLNMTNGRNNNGIPTKGIRFRIFNPTHKTIKYVIANLHAVNKFNDRISGDQRCRGMGPVESHEFGEWDFNDVFDDKNDVIDDLKVSFTVVYTNGSSKTIRWKDAYVSDFKSSWFYNR